MHHAGRSIRGNQDGDGFVGEAFGEALVEAFGEDGTSLGTVPVNGTGSFGVTTLFGGALTTGFTVTADVDTFRIGSVTLAPLTCEPGV